MNEVKTPKKPLIYYYIIAILLLLLIVPLSWKLSAVGCLLLLLLWSDHPFPLLLLGSPVLCIRRNPETLWLS